MSQGSAPCQGYVVELTDELIQKLGITMDFLKLIKESLPQNTEIPDNVYDTPGHARKRKCTYTHRPRDYYDELEDGKLYLIFDEDDLYTKIETEEFKALSALGMTPKEKSWTNFG